MGFRIKNEKTGQLGWQVYADKPTATASAKAHSKIHGVRCSVVNENGQLLPKARRLTADQKLAREAGQQMWRTINFTCHVGRI